MRGVHGEKVVATLNSGKLPPDDIPMMRRAVERYDIWYNDLIKCNADTIDELIEKMVSLLNDYKLFLDLDLIFDSKQDFLYRQKGQLKLDNTVVEEFLPIFVRKCVEKEFGTLDVDINIGSQVPTFSSAYFNSSFSTPGVGGGFAIKTKDQDFSVSRKLYIKSSYSSAFPLTDTTAVETHLGYILAEIKTNLDKTMFQEASSTAHDVKQAVTGAHYYLLCDFLDMTPISTAITSIDEILITRKARRIGSQIRSSFNTYSGRQEKRVWYSNYLIAHPYSFRVFKRFIEHIFAQIKNEDLIEDDVLEIGYF